MKKQGARTENEKKKSQNKKHTEQTGKRPEEEGWSLDGDLNQKVIATDSCEHNLGLWHPQGYALSPVLFVFNLVLKANAITGRQMISS